MPATVLPPLMCNKIGLAEHDGAKAQFTAALVRSRRHKSPEKQPENVVVIAYDLNQDERTAIAEGALLFVGQVTHGGPPYEQLVHIGVDTAAEYYQVEPATPELLDKARADASTGMDRAWEKYQASVESMHELTTRPHSASDRDRVWRQHGEALRGLEDALHILGTANRYAGVGGA